MGTGTLNALLILDDVLPTERELVDLSRSEFFRWPEVIAAERERSSVFSLYFPGIGGTCGTSDVSLLFKLAVDLMPVEENLGKVAKGLFAHLSAGSISFTSFFAKRLEIEIFFLILLLPDSELDSTSMVLASLSFLSLLSPGIIGRRAGVSQILLYHLL